MRILLITSYFPPENGAAATLFHELGRELVRLGHEITVVTGMPEYLVTGDAKKYQGRLRLEEKLDGMRVRRWAAPRFGAGMNARGLWQMSSALTCFISALTAGPQDVALVYSPPLFLGLSAWALRCLRGTPYVVNVQDLFPQSAIDMGVLRSGTAIGVFRRVERFVLSRANSVVVHGEANREHVERCGAAGKAVVIPNWIDTESAAAGDDSRARARHGSAREFIVTFAGLLGLSQDLDIVLEAARSLKEDARVEFLIAGDGLERERIQRKALEMGLANVRFLPMLAKSEYFDLLAASAVGLVTLKPMVGNQPVPSKIGGLMAAGKPIVAAVKGDSDAAKLIRESDVGVVTEAGDAAGFVAAIRALVDDPAARQRMAENGRRTAESQSARRAATRFVEVFRAATKEG